MSDGVPYLTCRWCGYFGSITRLRKEHGERMPVCVGNRTWNWAADNHYRMSGKRTASLDMAGVQVMRPMAFFQWKNAGNKKITKGRNKGKLVPVWVREYMLTWEAFAPQWAVELADRLVNDQTLIQRLGGKPEPRSDGWARKMVRRGHKVETRANQATGEIRPVAFMLSIEERASIIRAAAQSSLAREFVDDDLEAAALMLRSQK